MELNAYLKKKFLYLAFSMSILFLILSIFSLRATFILSAVLLFMACLYMLILYTKNPAVSITKEHITMQSLFSKTTYPFNNIQEITYIDNNKRIQITLDDSTTFLIQDAYIDSIFNALTLNKKPGETNDPSFTKDN